MKKVMYVLLPCVLLLAFILRFHHYAAFPPIGETKDEYAWTFLGASLLQTGRPVSWSHFASYQPFRTLQFAADQFPLVTPAMDHPPLFSMLPGVFQALVDRWDAEPRFTVIRFPMVLLGVFNIGLLYLVAKKYFTHRHALLASVIFATAPLFVFASRMVLAENLLVTWLLLALWLYEEKMSQKRMVLLALVLAASILTKMAGLVLPAAFFLYSLAQRNRNTMSATITGVLLGGGIFIGYGMVYGWSTFVAVFLNQSQRLVGLATLHTRFFLHPNILSRIFIDGWLMLGLLSQVWSIFFHPKKPYLLFHLISVLTLAFIAVTVGETTYHGWYIYPLFPLFSFSIAQLLSHLIEKEKWLALWLCWLIILPIFRTATGYLDLQLAGSVIKVLVLVGALPLLLSVFKVSQSVMKATVSLLLIAVLCANIISVWNVSAEKYWEDDEIFQPKMIVK